MVATTLTSWARWTLVTDSAVARFLATSLPRLLLVSLGNPLFYRHHLICALERP